jgi:hypothetical protein
MPSYQRQLDVLAAVPMGNPFRFEDGVSSYVLMMAR